MALNIKNAVGEYELINARQSHPLINIVVEKGLDPDKGIIVIYNSSFYHGAEAIQLLSLLNSPSSYFNKFVGFLLRSKLISKILYPFLKLIRKLLLKTKGIEAIQHKQQHSIFKKVFATDWEKLPPLMKKRFANRAYSDDCVQVSGLMNIRASRWMRAIKPLLRFSGALIAPEGENIPVEVNYRSESSSQRYWFERTFKTNPPMRFNSFMLNHKENTLVEYMKFNVGWRSKFYLKNNNIIMQHDGYVFRFFNILIPIPLALLLGKCNVIEKPVSDTDFTMDMSLDHFLFGKIYEYSGIFTISDLTS